MPPQRRVAALRRTVSGRGRLRQVASWVYAGGISALMPTRPRALAAAAVVSATIHRVLVRRGPNRLRDLDPPTGQHPPEVIRYEHDRVGDLVHVDLKKLGQTYLHSALDDHSRLAYTEALEAREGPARA